jgi:hypothetical protein
MLSATMNKNFLLVKNTVHYHWFLCYAQGRDLVFGKGFLMQNWEVLGETLKLPQPVEVALMMQHYKWLELATRERVCFHKGELEVTLCGLQCMAHGGMHDHIGGGFHCYS